jgi:putative ABC transport system permease protein
MIKNYFKTAWRNLIRHRTDSLINITGLCVAFTSALLLILSVGFEFSYDKFHLNGKDIYRLYFLQQRAAGTELNSQMPAPLTPTFKAEYPDVKYASRVARGGSVVRYKDKKFSESVTFADPDFFSMFSFRVVKGTKVPLHDLSEVVLKMSTAKAIFGTEEPVGKVIELQQEGKWRPFTVSAITEDGPENSSIRFGLVTRFENLSFYKDVSAAWDDNFHEAYVQLVQGVRSSEFEKKLAPFVNRYFSENIQRYKRDGAQPTKDGAYMKILLEPLAEVHTSTEIGGNDSINISYLYLLEAIAMVIIAIASINFINLSIGKSFTRSKEIGLRKTMGALRNHVAFQFWSEALLICSIAFVVSCTAAYLLLPEYKSLFDMHVQRSMLQSVSVWAYILLGFLIVTLIAGGYPAWMMSRFNVVQVLKGRTAARGSNMLRNGLITFQFVISVILISATIISWEQIHYLRTKPLGYNTAQVISIPVSTDISATVALQLMRNELARTPAVESVSGMNDNLGLGTDGGSRSSIMGFDYKNREIKSNWMGISYDLVKTLDLKLVGGRDFSSAFASDSNGVLINEAMANQIGEKQVVGMKLPVDSTNSLTVIGVVRDFNFKSLRKQIGPLTMVLDKNFPINYIMVKVKPANLSATMDLVKNAWKKISPSGEFQGSFLDENVNRQYKKEEKLMQIFTSGAIIAIAISCMGLLAIVILIVSQRTREFGIRKVLGASVQSIVGMVTRDFIFLVLIATVVAAPLTWLAMNKWLQSFAYRISIQWYIFLAAGLLAMAIAMITVCLQAIKAAMAKPVMSLRAE